MTIIHSREQSKIRHIQRKIQNQFEQKMVPSGEEICKKQLFNLIDKMQNVTVDEQQIDPFMPAIYKKLEWLSREDLINRFVSLEFNRFLDYYRNAPDLNILQKESKQGSRKAAGQMFTRFFINAGSLDGMAPSNLMGLINEKTKKRNIEIGKIEIMKKFSFFEIDSTFAERLIKGFKDAEYSDRKLVLEIASDKPASSVSRRNKDKKFGTRKPRKTKRRSKSRV